MPGMYYVELNCLCFCFKLIMIFSWTKFQIINIILIYIYRYNVTCQFVNYILCAIVVLMLSNSLIQIEDLNQL